MEIIDVILKHALNVFHTIENEHCGHPLRWKIIRINEYTVLQTTAYICV